MLAGWNTLCSYTCSSNHTPVGKRDKRTITHCVLVIFLSKCLLTGLAGGKLRPHGTATACFSILLAIIIAACLFAKLRITRWSWGHYLGATRLKQQRLGTKFLFHFPVPLYNTCRPIPFPWPRARIINVIRTSIASYQLKIKSYTVHTILLLKLFSYLE